ncbi:hypothetical protein BH10PSE5_BH10PSE5_28940 [soil metagenome]
MRLLPTAFAALLSAAALPAPFAQAHEWGGIFSAVMVASDYRYQGSSSSNLKPVVQGYAHLYRPDGYYAGVFATQVDYGYDSSPTYEVDLYGGKNIQFGKTEVKLEAMYSAYPDNQTWGPTLDFLSLKAAAKRTDGKVSLGGAAVYTPQGPYGAGEGWRVEGEAGYAVNPHLKLKALAGQSWTHRGQDRGYWELGAVTTWKNLALEIRYTDNSLSRARCGFNPDICDPTVVGTLTVSLPPIY